MAEQPKVVQSEDQKRADEALQAREQQAAQEAAKAPKIPEMRPGGEYLVNGVRVDANGEPIKSKPKDGE